MRPDSMRLVLALRHPLMLEALEELLSRSGIKVVARCVEPAALERCLRAHAPDVALVDAELASGDVADLIRAASRGLPGGRLVLLAPRIDAALARDTLALAVDGVVSTGMSGADLVAALHRVAMGSSVFPAGWLAAANQRQTSALDSLSARQLEVLELLAQGLPNELIAGRLFISRNTVKFHVAAIYQRLGVRNRVQAAHALASLKLSA
ncbi:MAG TPA: response regulator transcription factor [Solirubrobacteraceae bacterium]|nr:response regulator transcription factor [Solirubrobacteraceae bacterium]